MVKIEEGTNPNSCFSKAKDDEMLFVLRGQDASAPSTVLFWMAQNIHLATTNPSKYREAFECLMVMASQVKKSAD